MKKLIVTRGCPGSGKSTWIRNNNLHNYTLCPDELRLICTAPKLQSDGTFRISQDGESFVWKILKQILDYRLQHGYLTVIDATCNRIKDIKEYKALADQYGYELLVVDFTDVPIATCIRQNTERDRIKWVPEEAIFKLYQRFASQKLLIKDLKKEIQILKPDEIKPEDLCK